MKNVVIKADVAGQALAGEVLAIKERTMFLGYSEGKKKDGSGDWFRIRILGKDKYGEYGSKDIYLDHSCKSLLEGIKPLSVATGHFAIVSASDAPTLFQLTFDDSVPAVPPAEPTSTGQATT